MTRTSAQPAVGAIGWAARVVVAASALLWLAAAGAKIAEPFPAYEFAVRLAGGGTAAKALVVTEVFVEVLLGVAILSRGVRTVPAAVGSLVWLGLASVALLVVQGQGHGAAACGCFATLADETVSEALGRNLVIGGLLSLALVLALRGATSSAGQESTTGKGSAAPRAPAE